MALLCDSIFICTWSYGALYRLSFWRRIKIYFLSVFFPFCKDLIIFTVLDERNNFFILLMCILQPKALFTFNSAHSFHNSRQFRISKPHIFYSFSIYPFQLCIYSQPPFDAPLIFKWNIFPNNDSMQCIKIDHWSIKLW